MERVFYQKETFPENESFTNSTNRGNLEKSAKCGGGGRYY
jgi:hypothetical protein